MPSRLPCQVLLVEAVETGYRKIGMFTRSLGLHRANSLFNFRLEPGELMWGASFRDKARFSPPDAEGGLTLMDLALFFLCFPLSRTATAALHGWAAALPAPALLLAMPACAAIALLQVAATMLALVAVLGLSLFGSIFAMCAYGARPSRSHTRRRARHRTLRSLIYPRFSYFLRALWCGRRFSRRS